MSQELPNGLKGYGFDANCTLELCPVEASAISYRPSLPVNGAFISLFGLSMMIHIIQGIRYKAWWFMGAMILGCVDEIIGYSARIWLYHDPFAYKAFVMQIVCLTTGPVFFSAAIYVTLSQAIEHLDSSLSRFRPRLYYYIFIPADLLSLAIQGGAGAASAASAGADLAATKTAVGGLSIQVITLVAFAALAADYLIRWGRSPTSRTATLRFKVFLTFLTASILLIFARCAWRIHELNEGYFSEVFHRETPFYVFESTLVAAAVLALNVGHPGFGMPTSRGSNMGRDVNQEERVVFEEGKELSSGSDTDTTRNNSVAVPVQVKGPFLSN